MRYLGIALVLVIGLFVATPAWAEGKDVANTAETNSVEANEQQAEEASESSPAKESVVFDGETLNLAWQGDNPGETVKEFIPAGQDLESWTKLASIREYAELDDVPALIGAFVRVLKERYPRSAVKVFENGDTDAVMLEFTVWPGEEEMQDPAFVEYNIFKYAKQQSGGIVAQQYALRAYDHFDKFLRKLEPNKKRLLEQMGNDGLQIDSDDQADTDEDEQSEAEDSDSDSSDDDASDQ